MPFGIPSEDFHGGFGIPHDDDEIEPVAAVKLTAEVKETAITYLLVRAGVTQAPRKVARFLRANGVDIVEGE